MLDYAALQDRTDAPPGSAWGLHGADDQIGTLNFLTPECAVAAARLVRTGKTYNLDCALDAFDLPHRTAPTHVVLGKEHHHTRDDYLDRFYPQAGTQVDGLRHFRHPRYGFYNHAKSEEIAAGTPAIGVQHYADKAIVGRGVLIDVGRYLEARGTPVEMRGGLLTADLLDEVAAAQGVSFEAGDILLLRTGWLDGYFNGFDDEFRAELAKKVTAPGLVQAHRSLEWLWNNRFSIIAADTPGFEAVPASPDSPFAAMLEDVPGVPGALANMMHPILIPMLGFCIGELWDLDALATDCAADGNYAFMVTVSPLNLVGGVGSPANAIAIK